MFPLVFGPRRVTARRLVCVPRRFLREMQMGTPARVEFVAQGDETVLLRTPLRGETDFPAATISSVGQVVLPRPVLESLNLSSDRMLYMRPGRGLEGVTLMSPRQALGTGPLGGN